MTRETEWLAKLDCRAVIERSVQYVDDGQAAAFAKLFCDDAVLVRPNGTAIEGRAAIEAAYAQRPSNRITRHLVTNVVVDLDAPDRAQARSYVLLWSGSNESAESPFGYAAEARQLIGEFLDVLVQSASGDWMIQRRIAKFVLQTSAG